MNHLTENQKTENPVSVAGKRLIQNTDTVKKRKGFRKWTIGLLAFILALIGLLVWAMYGYNGTYPNITFAGSKIGGLSQDEATKVIESVMTTYADEKIEVRYDNEILNISALDAGAAISVPDALQAAIAIGRTGSVFEKIGTILSSPFVSRAVGIETEADIEAIKIMLKDFEQSAYREKVDSEYQVFTNEIRLDKGVDGQSLDVEKVAEEIADRIISRKLDPIDLTDYFIQDKTSGINLVDVYNTVYTESADAYLDISGKEPKIVPHVTGVSFDLTSAQQLVGAKDDNKRVVYIPLIRTEPEMTTEVYHNLLFRDVLSEIKTTLNASNLNRTGNVRISANAINGKILLPGDVFSYNETVGERTYESGYKDASVYTSDGIEDQLGGGICQTSSTLYMNVIRVGLEITQRANHSYTVAYAPLGEDATVYWGSLDFKFTNNQNYPIKVEAYQQKDYIVVRILGTATDNNTVKIETVTLSNTPYTTTYIKNPNLEYGIKKQTVEGHSAYKVESYRVVYDANGKEISRTKLPNSRYKKLDRVIEVGIKNQPLETVSPAATVSPSIMPSPSASPTVSPTVSPSDAPSPSVSP